MSVCNLCSSSTLISVQNRGYLAGLFLISVRQRRVRALAQIARFNRPDYRADALDLQVEGPARQRRYWQPAKLPVRGESRSRTVRAADVSPPDKPPGDARGRGLRRPAGHADDACARRRPRLPTRGRSSRGPASGADGGDARRWGRPGIGTRAGTSRDAVTERFVAFGDHR